MEEIQHYKFQGHPYYSSMMIEFYLLLRYSSCQTYQLLFEQLPLSTLSLLKKKPSSGIADSMKVAKLLLGKKKQNKCHPIASF